LTPFEFPRDDDVRRGISTITLPDIRWMRRDLKTTMLLPAVLAKREARRRGAQEAIYVGPSDIVHEGASSNVFAVEGTVLVTPAQSTHLLPGTMRPLVSQVAKEAGLEVHNAEVSLARLSSAAEVFVTSSSQLVMSVISIDGKLVRDGQGGPIARDLAKRLRERLGIG
jgi:D-alanine transaminase